MSSRIIGILPRSVSFGGELETSPIIDNGQATIGNQLVFLGKAETINSGNKLILPTSITWKNGTVVAGNIEAGIYVLDAEPPVNTGGYLIAKTSVTAASGASSEQTANFVYTNTFKAGSIVFPAIAVNDATHTLRVLTGQTSQNRYTDTSAALTELPAILTSAWSVSTSIPYLKLTYRLSV